MMSKTSVARELMVMSKFEKHYEISANFKIYQCI